MKIITIFGAVAFATSQVLGDCEMRAGNFYCKKVDAVHYKHVGHKGSYMDVTHMDEKSCKCSQTAFPFEGSLAPFDQELSVHFRGPLRLNEFGVYYPSKKKRSVINKKKLDDDVSTGVGHSHEKEGVHVVEIHSTLYVNNKNEIVSEVKNVLSTSVQKDDEFKTMASSSSPSASVTKPSESNQYKLSDVDSKPKSKVGGGSSKSWKRTSYYTFNSTENCVFLNHKGGTAGSGIWSSCFGNSISYAASNGVSGASKPTPLGNVTLDSNQEYMIFSGEKCDGDCGYYRDGIPAYHGFGGVEKIFVFEFLMPKEFDGFKFINDMPAIWLLNAKIPRTLQYGEAKCSCWKTGCGEIDLFEVLTPGLDSLISHIHSGQGVQNSNSNAGGGGTPNYFERPTTTPMRAAVVFSSDNSIHIVKVEDKFGPTLSDKTVKSWLESKGSVALLP